MHRRFNSLQFRLAVRLALLFIAATALVFVILAYRAYETAGSLNDRELSLRAEDLAGSVRLDGAGHPNVELSPSLIRAYSGSGTLYAIRKPGGPVIAASSPSFADRVRGWPAAGEDPSYFRLTGVDGAAGYYGLSIALDSAAGPLWISVAQAGEANTLVQSLLWEFGNDLTWIIPLFLLVTLAIGAFAIRGGLKPVKAVAAMAAAIGPEATSVRLPEHNLPMEVAPLVHAINHALDRLDQGFAVQRQFTANAAHELRTPLAIITAALDSLPATGELASLKRDVARMNRLVEQLLRVARLDAISLEMSEAVDLDVVASEVVAATAPWAVAQGREVAFTASGRHVRVFGDPHAIGDAIRNGVENAVLYAPPGDEIRVQVEDDWRVLVTDHGPGIPANDRERAFDRFWRGKGSGVEGAGLGLSITRDIMIRHGGSAQVEENPGGGTVLVLAFPPGPSSATTPTASESRR
jgi:two-component system, OmpR family, sensor histidine kinase TctE